MPSILNISDAASLALHGMAVLAQQGQKMVCAHQVASELNVSEAHLAKVLQRLVKAGLIESIRGPKGGFRLNKPADQIRLLDIYQAVEGSLARGTCLFNKALCNGHKCIFGSILGKANALVSGHLTNTTLSTLAKTYRSKINDEKKHH